MVQQYLIRPNDKQDYYGSNYDMDDVFAEYSKALKGEVSNPIIKQEIPDHIKLSKEKDITGFKGEVISNETNTKNIEGQNFHTSPNETNETLNHPNLESATGDKEDIGNEERENWLDWNNDGKVDSSDLSGAVYDAGNKVYSITAGAVKTVGEGSQAMIHGASKSAAGGLSEGLDIEGKWAEAKSGAKEEISRFKEDVKKEVDKKYADLKVEVSKKEEQLKTGLYVGAGFLALYLLMRKS